MRIIIGLAAALLLCSGSSSAQHQPKPAAPVPTEVTAYTDTAQMVKVYFVIVNGRFVYEKQAAPVVVNKQEVKPDKNPPQKDKPK
jgi:hypothetical protein